MTTYGSEFDGMISRAKNQMALLDQLQAEGDLWNMYVVLQKIEKEIVAAMELVLTVSKVAFERVMKERA